MVNAEPHDRNSLTDLDLVIYPVFVFAFKKKPQISLFNTKEMSILFFFRAAPAAYEGSQARGQIGATAASLHHRHSNAGSKPSLLPIPQLTAMPDP